jgi:hypothetical protein
VTPSAEVAELVQKYEALNTQLPFRINTTLAQQVYEALLIRLPGQSQRPLNQSSTQTPPIAPPERSTLPSDRTIAAAVIGGSVAMLLCMALAAVALRRRMRRRQSVRLCCACMHCRVRRKPSVGHIPMHASTIDITYGQQSSSCHHIVACMRRTYLARVHRRVAGLLVV